MRYWIVYDCKDFGINEVKVAWNIKFFSVRSYLRKCCYFLNDISALNFDAMACMYNTRFGTPNIWTCWDRHTLMLLILLFVSLSS